MAADILPFALSSGAAALAIWAVPVPCGNIAHELNPVSLAALCIQGVAGMAAALAVLSLLKVPELKEGYAMLLSRLRKMPRR